MYGYRRRNSLYCRELQQEEEAEEKELLRANRLSMNAWKYAQSPNYNQNENFFYPYSELDYVGEYDLLKIPVQPQEYIDHVDYWGEGRIVTEEGTSGFPNCYNVNERYKLVSRGADVDRKIPNRIPVFSSTDCNTSDYIKDESVKLVTVSGGGISRSCARDIARIVAQNSGVIVAVGYDIESDDIKILEKALSKKSLIHCPGRRIPPLQTDDTGPNLCRTYVHVEYLDEELQRHIAERDFEEALKISRVFISRQYFSRIYNVVHKMLNGGSSVGHASVMYYVYYLWSHNEQETVTRHLQGQFAAILNGEILKIVHDKHNLPLKFDDRDDVSMVHNITYTWKFLPIWENNNLSFKIQNVDSKLFLTLGENKAYGTRPILGSSISRELKFKWSLAPLLHNNNLLFYIVNKQFLDGLSVDAEIKQSGRHVISIEGSTNKPEIYGWKVESVKRHC